MCLLLLVFVRSSVCPFVDLSLPRAARALDSPFPHSVRFPTHFIHYFLRVPHEPRWEELASEFLVEMQGVFGLTQPSMLEIVLQVGFGALSAPHLTRITYIYFPLSCVPPSYYRSYLSPLY